MERLKLALFSIAQQCWIAIRAAGHALLGPYRFDRLIDRTGLRGLKSRAWLSERTLPDGNKILYRPHDQCIVDEVYEKGIYSCSDLRPGGTVIDAGAHIGTFSLMAARRVGPSGRVLAFEPSPRTHELLRRNLDANGLSWVKPYSLALADKDGSADFFIAGGAKNNPAADTLVAENDRERVSVKTRRLDDILAEEQLDEIDLLKVDVEGAELLVMDGAANALKRTRRLVMEIHPPRVDPAEVRRLLGALGFSCRTVHEAPGGVILDARR